MRKVKKVSCVSCGKEALEKNEIGINKKLLGEQVESFYCMDCLADYLGVTTSDLLGETKKPTVQDDGLTEAEQALMDLFRQLTPDQQDLVIRMVQAAADKQ